MTMMTKAMKGISFLLCLGFLIIANSDAWAKSNADKLAEYKTKLNDTETYGECNKGKALVSNWKDCASQSSAVDNAQKALDGICNIYSTVKNEFKKCKAGEKDDSKQAYEALTNAQKKLSDCEKNQEDTLSQIKSALSECKDAQQAKKKADKADSQAEKAAKENAEAQAVLQKAEAAYNEAVEDCKKGMQEACNAMKDLYKDYEQAAKKAGKTAKAENEAFGKAEAKNQKAIDAAASTCASNRVWNQYLQRCAFFSDTKTEAEEENLERAIASCYNNSSKNLSDANSCRSQWESEQKELETRDVAEKKCLMTNDCDDWNKIKEQDKKAEEAKAAQEAYSQKLLECGSLADDDPDRVKCEQEAEKLGKAAAALGGSNSTGGTRTGVGANDGEVNKLIAEATKPKCSGVSKTGEARGTFGIFDYLACKITTVVADLRVIVYILAGFGMIAFAYSAILGKIEFKRLANIAIGLFILSMTTGIIEEIVFNDGTSHLQYGDFLPNGNHEQYFQTSSNCNTNRELCPDYTLAGAEAAAENSKWSLSADNLKAAIKAGQEAASKAKNTYVATKAAVDSTVKAANRIKDAIDNGGNIYDVAAEIAGDVSRIVSNVNFMSNTMGDAANIIATDIRDGTATEEQRQYLEELLQSYTILKGKCSTGSCSKNELEALAVLESKVKENQTTINAWLNNDGAGGGATFLNDLQNLANITGAASRVAISAQAGKNEGQSIGGDNALGDTLGMLFGLGNAYNAGTDKVDELQNNGSFDFRSQQTKDAEAKEQALAAAQGSCQAVGGTYSESTGKCTRADGADIDMATGAATIKNADGSTTTVLKGQDGSTTTTVKNADGSTKTTTVNADGSSVTVARVNGHTVVINKDKNGNTTQETVDGMSKEHQDCITTRGGKWENGTCVGMTKTAEGCGIGQVRYNGTCMSAEAKKQAEEAARLAAAQAECAKKQGYTWDGKECKKAEEEKTAGSPCTEDGKTGVWNKAGTGCCVNGLDSDGWCVKSEKTVGSPCTIDGKTGVWNKTGTGCCVNGLDSDGWCVKTSSSSSQQ